MSPDDAGVRWPTLGPQVVAWMEANLVFGPGDLRGKPLELDDEQRAFLYKFYEVYPHGHVNAGRRRFRRCALSLAKGLRKTELAAFTAAAELDPSAPVRFNGWRGRGLAPGKGVTDPFVILVAYTEEQSDELAYGALRVILQESRLARDYDIGLERIIRKSGAGKAVSLSGSPNARDGARTTFQVFDETHRMVLPRLKAAHQTMQANLPKRKLSDAWALEITTAPEPGAGSIAEGTMDYAQAVIDGKLSDDSLFFFHRQASDAHDLTTREGARAAVVEASGQAAEWRDIDAIVSLWSDPTTDKQYWERVWCNRLVQSSSQAFDVGRWRALELSPSPVAAGDLITLGFDGALVHDSTALVATHVKTGYQWKAGLWEAPPGRANWEVPAGEVDALVRDLFGRFNVWRLYADPPYWQSWIALWQSLFTQERVISWGTNRHPTMARAIEGFSTAIASGTVRHDGDRDLTRHLGNSRRQYIGQRDEQGRPLWVISKERSDSPQKIDAAVAAVLSWQARTDAVAAGVNVEPEYRILTVGGRG